jgi:hypothetical protein
MLLGYISGQHGGGGGDCDDVDNYYYYTKRKFNVLTYRKNNRLEIEPLLVQLAEKHVEIVNEPTRLRNSLILLCGLLGVQ